MAVAGISSLGVTFYYGVESEAGIKPTSFSQLTRINEIGGISLESEQLDASALEDMISRYIAGRMDTGGTFSVSVNVTDETITEWKAVIEAYKALSGGKRMWFETVIPGITDGFFVVAQPPQAIPQPEIGQKEVLVMEMPLVVEEYIGLDTKVVA